MKQAHFLSAQVDLSVQVQHGSILDCFLIDLDLIPSPFGHKSIKERYSCLFIFPFICSCLYLTSTNVYQVIMMGGQDALVVLYFCLFFCWSGDDGDLGEVLAAPTRATKLLLLSLSSCGCKLPVRFVLGLVRSMVLTYLETGVELSD